MEAKYQIGQSFVFKGYSSPLPEGEKPALKKGETVTIKAIDVMENDTDKTKTYDLYTVVNAAGKEEGLLVDELAPLPEEKPVDVPAEEAKPVEKAETVSVAKAEQADRKTLLSLSPVERVKFLNRRNKTNYWLMAEALSQIQEEPDMWVNASGEKLHSFNDFIKAEFGIDASDNEFRKYDMLIKTYRHFIKFGYGEEEFIKLSGWSVAYALTALRSEDQFKEGFAEVANKNLSRKDAILMTKTINVKDGTTDHLRAAQFHQLAIRIPLEMWPAIDSFMKSVNVENSAEAGDYSSAFLHMFNTQANLDISASAVANASLEDFLLEGERRYGVRLQVAEHDHSTSVPAPVEA